MNCVQMTLHSAATFNFISFVVFFSIHFILDIHDGLSHFNHIKTYDFYAFFSRFSFVLYSVSFIFICIDLFFFMYLLPPQMLEAASAATQPEVSLLFIFYNVFFILLELSQYIACGERPQQREGFRWHILAPRKTRSDLGRRDPVKAPNLRENVI